MRKKIGRVRTVMYRGKTAYFVNGYLVRPTDKEKDWVVERNGFVFHHCHHWKWGLDWIELKINGFPV